MTNDPNDLELILTALRDAQAAPGMEERVLERLRDSALPVCTGVSWVRGALYVVLAGLAIAFVGFFGLHHAREQTSAQGGSAMMRRSQDVPAKALPKAVPPRSPQQVVVHRLETRRDAAPEPVLQQDATVNIPEPPMPLTEQEVLLRRAVRHDPENLAQTAAAKAEAQRQEERELEAFFAPPPPLPDQPYYKQTIISGGSQ